MKLATAESRYYIGLVANTGRMSYKQLVASRGQPGLSTSVTFGPLTMDDAAIILRVATSRDFYSEGLHAAVHAGFGYRSANLGEYQLASIVRPGDLWAAVVYLKGRCPVLATGTHAHLQHGFVEMNTKGRLADPESTPPDIVFRQFHIDLMADILS